MNNLLDVVFNHVESAVRALQVNDTEKALRLLEMIRGPIASEALKVTNGAVGSEHYHNLIDVILEKYPREVDE